MRFFFYYLTVTVCCIGALVAQDISIPPADVEFGIDPSWGTAAETAAVVSAWDMEPGNVGETATRDGAGYRYITMGNGFWLGPASLPSGAAVTAIEIQACDTNATLQMQADLLRFFNNGTVSGFASVTPQVGSGAAFVGGCGLFRLNLVAPFPVIDNAVNTYGIRAFNSAIDGTIKFMATRVFYKLQVSPAPATATFTDVSNAHPFYQFIEALAASGITAGCQASPPMYCPDATLTRGQMAVFLARALGLHFTP